MFLALEVNQETTEAPKMAPGACVWASEPRPEIQYKWEMVMLAKLHPTFPQSGTSDLKKLLLCFAVGVYQ